MESPTLRSGGLRKCPGPGAFGPNQGRRPKGRKARRPGRGNHTTLALTSIRAAIIICSTPDFAYRHNVLYRKARPSHLGPDSNLPYTADDACTGYGAGSSSRNQQTRNQQTRR